jgi:hypothetical protein
MDRSKFKGGSVKSIKETRKDAEAKSGMNDRVGYHSIDEGINVFRIMPPHPGNSRPYVPLRRSFLRCNSEKWENGERTGEFEVKNKSIFISTIHGGTEQDIIELYCDMVYQRVKQMCEELKGEEKKKKEAELLFPIRGGRTNKKYQSGIQPSTSYTCYALKDGKLGRLDLYSTWMKKIEELNIDEDGDEEAAVDRFSDPEKGVHLIISKKKKEKGADGFDYTLKKREFSPTKFKNWDEFIESERVTDKQLEEFLGVKTLEELCGSNVYRRSDYLMAVDGLQRIDEENHYEVFQDEDFIAKLKEFDSLFPEETEEEGTHNEDVNISQKETFKGDKDNETMNPDGEDFTTWGIPKLRGYIQNYIDTNYPGEVLPAMAKPKLIEWAVLVEKEDDLPFSGESDTTSSDQSKEEKKVIEKEVKNETTKMEITPEAQARIDKLKGLGKKK